MRESWSEDEFVITWRTEECLQKQKGADKFPCHSNEMVPRLVRDLHKDRARCWFWHLFVCTSGRRSSLRSSMSTEETWQKAGPGIDIVHIANGSFLLSPPHLLTTNDGREGATALDSKLSLTHEAEGLVVSLDVTNAHGKDQRHHIDFRRTPKQKHSRLD